MGIQLFVKGLIFLVVVPGTVVVFLPSMLLSSEQSALPSGEEPWRYLGAVPIVPGVYTLLRCIWDFLTVGKGTPAPIDPPKELVVSGLYRYVRNPMYVGVLLILAGESVLFASMNILVYAVVFGVFVHLFIVFYEEPTLQRTFGESYSRYCRSVRRWIPRFRRVEGAGDRASAPP